MAIALLCGHAVEIVAALITGVACLDAARSCFVAAWDNHGRGLISRVIGESGSPHFAIIPN